MTKPSLQAEIREVEIDRDVDGFARCWTEYAVVVNGYEEDSYGDREEAESLLVAFITGREKPTLPEPVVEEDRWLRPGAYLLQWTNPRTTDVIGAIYGPTEEHKTSDEARAALVADARRLARMEAASHTPEGKYNPPRAGGRGVPRESLAVPPASPPAGRSAESQQSV